MEIISSLQPIIFHHTEYNYPQWVSGIGMQPNHPFLYTPKDAMLQFMGYIKDTYKTTEKYLLSCGVTAEDIKIIKQIKKLIIRFILYSPLQY